MKTEPSWLETVLLVAPFVVRAIYWNDMPARVRIHWNFRYQIDGWTTKTPGLFIIPLTALGRPRSCASCQGSIPGFDAPWEMKARCPPSS
jgi:Domain of unknown function (DUF1648)